MEKGDTEERAWAVGFGDDGYGRLTYPEPKEDDEYEYDFILLAKCGDGSEFTEAKKLEKLIHKVKKPELKEFKLEYRDEYIGDTLVAKGSIKHLAPDTTFAVGIWLTRNKLPGNEFFKCVNKKNLIGWVEENGDLEIPIDWYFWYSSKINLEEHMAVLFLPQTKRSTHALKYDHVKYATCDGKKIRDGRERVVDLFCDS